MNIPSLEDVKLELRDAIMEYTKNNDKHGEIFAGNLVDAIEKLIDNRIMVAFKIFTDTAIDESKNK